MPAWEIIVSIKKDGVDLGGFPFRRAIETAEGADFNVVQNDGQTQGEFVPFPAGPTGNMQLFIATTDQPVDLQPSARSPLDGIVSLLAGGLLLIFNAVSAISPPSESVAVSNFGTQPANIKGAWGSS